MVTLCCVACLFAPAGIAAAARSPATAPVPLASANTITGHPRLIANAARVTAVKQSTDPATVWMRSQVISRANYLLTAEPIVRDPTAIRLLSTSYVVIDHAYNMAGAYLLTGNTRYTDRLWQDLQTVAAFPNWNPDYFLDTGEMALGFAIAYDWGYSAWSPEQRATLVNAIISHAIQPAQAAYAASPAAPNQSAFDSNWPTLRNNRNVIINSGIGMAAMAISGDTPNPAVDQVIDESQDSIRYGMSEYANDGGFAEGPTYWRWTTLRLTSYLTSLRISTGSDGGLSALPGLRETPSFAAAFVGASGNVAGFSDGSDGAVPMDQTTPLAGIAAVYGDGPLDAAQALSRKTGDVPARLFWHVPGQTAAPSSNKSLHRDLSFPSASYMSMRENWDDSLATSVSLRYGNSPGVDHQQEDGGSFSIDALGQSWAIDLGLERLSYADDGEGGARRLLYYRNRPEGHNTIAIQSSQDPYNGQAVTTRVASGVNTTSSFVVQDLTKLYPDVFTTWKRGVKLTDNRNQVVVQDEVAARQTTDAVWRMQTAAAISLSSDGRTAYLVQGNRLMQAQITSDQARFVVMAAAPLPLSPQLTQTANSGVQVLAVQLSIGPQVKRLTVQFTPMPSGRATTITPITSTPLSEWSLDPEQTVRASQLLVDGSPLAKFTPTTWHYNVATDDRQTVPQVSALAPSGTTVQLTQAGAVPGRAAVRLSRGGSVATYTVDFVAADPVAPVVPLPAPQFKVGLSPTSLTIRPGELSKLSWRTDPASVTPSSVDFSTSDARVASVDDDGVVTARSGGTATIAVSVASGGLWRSATATVQVADDTSVRVIAEDSGRIQGDQSTTAFGRSAAPAVKGAYSSSTGDAGVRIGYLQFQLPTLPTGARVVSATLNVRGGITDNGYPRSKVRVDAHLVTGPLDLSTVTYATRPASDPTIAGSSTFDRTTAFQPLDLTQLVQGRLSAGSQQFSVELSQDTPRTGLPALVSMAGVAGNKEYTPYLDLVLQDAPIPAIGASATSTRRGSVANTIDSSMSSGWEAWSPTAATWSFAQPNFVSSVEVAWGPTAAPGIGVFIESSADGSTWQTRARTTITGADTVQQIALSNGYASTMVRLRTTGGGLVGIKNITFYPTPGRTSSLPVYLDDLQWQNLPASLSVGTSTPPAQITALDTYGRPIAGGSYVFTSQDTSVVTTSATGALTPIAGGTTTVTVTSTDPATGNPFSKAFQVTVRGPMTVQLPVTGNAYVMGGDFANTSFGGDGSLQVKGPYTATQTSGAGVRITYLAFDISKVPAGSRVTSAVLNVRGAIFDNGDATSMRVDAHRVLGDWIPATVTYATRPVIEQTSAGHTDFTKTNIYQQIDVSELLTSARVGGATSISIALTEDTPANGSPLLVGLTGKSSATPPYLTVAINPS